MPASIINCTNPQKADVVLLGANFDQTSSFGKGADKAPAAIVNCLNTQIEFYDRFTNTTPVDKLQIAYQDLGNLNKLSPEQMVKKVGGNFDKYFSEDKFVMTLGGEHSISNGPLGIIAKKIKPADVTILHIDAHFDLRIDDADYNDKPHGKYAHCSVMRRIAELGFPITHVGIRAYAKEELDFAKNRKGTTVFEWGKGAVPTLAKILSAIKTKKVYISLDVDGIDPAFMPATGTPVQGGLDWYYALNLLSEIFKKKNVIGADIVEVAPRSTDTLTEYGAAQLVYHMIANLHM